MCMERRRFSQTMASEWQTAFVVSYKMSWCALLTAVKNYNKSLEKLQDFFFKTETKTKTKTKCSRPRSRLHDPRRRPRPRLSFLSSRRLETKTLVSRTTSLHSVQWAYRCYWLTGIDNWPFKFTILFIRLFTGTTWPITPESDPCQRLLTVK